MHSGLRLDAFLPYRLSFTTNLVSEAIASTYRSFFDLHIPEWRVLAVVAEHDGITQQEIGLRTRMVKVTVSRAAIALASRGLLDRSAAIDRRARLLTLSVTGRQLYDQVVPKALELEAEIFSALSRDEVSTLTAILRKLDASILERSESMMDTGGGDREAYASRD